MKKGLEKNPRKQFLKRIISFVLCFCVLAVAFPMALGVVAEPPEIWDGTVASGYAGGSGAWNDPYIISNGSELAFLGSVLSSGTGTAYENKYFELSADIYLNDISDYENWADTAPTNTWTSMGRYFAWDNCREFGGIFDGKGHTIYGLYVSGSTTGGTGLFGALNNATVKNFFVQNAYVSGTSNVGGLAGIIRGNTTIQNSGFSGIVKGSSNSIGGLVGRFGIDNSSTTLSFNSCFSEGTVSSDSLIAGGFVGFQAGNSTSVIINNSYSAAYVTGTQILGGFVGRLDDGSNNRTLTVRRSHFAGRVVYSSSYAWMVGSIAGQYTSNSTVTVSDTYYYRSEYSAFDVTDGTAKTPEEFADGTVMDLLNAALTNAATDYWNWAQAENYPVPDRQADSRLQSLSISAGEIDFKPTTTQYAFEVSHYVKSIKVTPIAKIGATITVNGANVTSGTESQSIALTNGVTRIAIVVTGADSSTLTYSLAVTRLTAELEVEIWDGSVAEGFDGTGLWDDPYIISNGSELALLSESLRDGHTGTKYENAYFKLTSDIYLNDVSDFEIWGTSAPENSFTPIGRFSSWSNYRDFGGIFDGNGHTIYGLYVSGSTNEGTGLFGALNGAIIKDVYLKDAYVSGSTNVGGFAGLAHLDVTIQNCGFTGVANASSNFAGGFIGKYEPTNGYTLQINSSFTEGVVSAGGVIAGGFVGDFASGNIASGIMINNSYCAANVTGNDYRAGGFIGRASNENTEKSKSVTIRRSHFCGTLSSASTGTLVGQDAAGITDVTDTYYNATIIGGAAKTFVTGTAKTTEAFADGTVENLLNLVEKQNDTDLWNYVEGTKYPESPKTVTIVDDVENYITVDKTFGKAGDVVQVTVTPAEGKVLKAGSLSYVFDGIRFPIYARYDSWVYTGNAKPEDSVGTYEDTGVYYFNLPSENAQIVAEFTDENTKNIALLAGHTIDEGLQFISRVYQNYSINDTVYSLSRRYGTILIRSDRCGALDVTDSAALESWLADSDNEDAYRIVKSTKLTDMTGNYYDFSVDITGIDTAEEKAVEYIAIAFAKYGDINNSPVTVYSNPCTFSYHSAKEKETIHNATVSDVITMKGAFTPMRGYKWVAAENKAIQIIKAEDELDLSGKTVYYVSPDGNDSANGMNENTAWRSAQKVTEFLNNRIANEDTSSIAILFERGGVYRQTEIFNINSNVTIGAYGEGAKPAIYGSKQNYSNESLWQPVDENETIWELAMDTDDVGLIVFGTDEAVGVKKNSYGDVKQNGDFYHDHDEGKLYLYFANGNPAEFYDKIEIGTKGNLFYLASNAENVIIDNLTIQYGGSHAIATSSNARDITVTNCEIAWIGGSYYEDGEFTRYGNGVQFWDSAENCQVSNNWIYQIYDAGITFQGGRNENSGTNSYENIIFNDNLIEYCTYSIEFFDRVPSSTAMDIYIMDNIMRFAGYGWGRQRPDTHGTAHICSWNTSGAFAKDNFQITGNTFEYTTGNFVYWEWANENSYDNVFVSGNSFYKSATFSGNAMNYGYDDEAEGTVQLKAYNQADLEDAVAVFDESPAEVVWVEN